MLRRALSKLPLDPYLIALIATVVLAALLPARGVAEPATKWAVSAAIFLLFALYGVRLSTQAVIQGLRHWRLQSLVMLSTFVIFPIIGLGLTAALRGVLPSELSLGLMFVCVLPSTVQSSIAFTSIARGNVPAALCSASVSNLFGMVLTPALMALLITTHGSGYSLKAIADIGVELLLPFVVGQLLRPWFGAWVARYKFVLSYVDRGSILLIVYSAFSESVIAGVWSRIDPWSLALILLVDAVLLAIVLVITTVASRALGFSKEDEIAIVFCGSKKSLASGVPMANILFAGQAVGAIVLPLMIFHQIQLFVCATLAQRYARRPVRADRAVGEGALANP